ncbi:MAG: hypothetical protein JKY09_05175 [Crocinitomicaceae bacterium]|nr:hypothetical protein [Crocinitomicaceae bacterium]
MNEDKIEGLWSWFYKNEQKIRDCVEQESAPFRDYIVQNLDDLILDLGMFSWAIGEGVHKKWSLTISPNGDKDLLEKSRRIIAGAPELVAWEFYFSKPAKEWDRKFVVYDDMMTEQQINASDWKYVSTQKGDGMIDLILEAENIGHLDVDTANTAADLVVLNEIGEENKIVRISSVSIVDLLDSNNDNDKKNITELKNQIR